MPLEVKPLEASNGIGCEVLGLTSAMLADHVVREELVRIWVEHGVIVFRGLEGADLQVELSRVFGDPQPHPHAKNQPGRHPEIVTISYDPDNADIYEVNGETKGGWLPWHMDLIYLDKVSRGSILRPVVLPYAGGETGFIDKIKLYEKLSPQLRRRIDGLSAVYHFDMDLDNMRYARPERLRVVSLSSLYSSIISRRKQYPRVRHPLVYRQAETDRPVLNFSPYFAQSITGLPQDESDAILSELGDLCKDHRNFYFHTWKADDMVLWDNWRMLHSAAGVPVDASRVMERTQIIGDYGLGQLESAEATIEECMRIAV